MNWIDENWLTYQSRVSPHKSFVIYQDETWHFLDIYRKKIEIQSILNAKKVQRGAHIAIILPNIPEYIASVFAIMGIAAIFVPINTRLTDREIIWQLRQAEIDLIITTMDYKNHDFNGIEVVFVDEQVDLSEISKISDRKIALEDIACFVFTSGTTGTPKIVPLSYGNFFFGAFSSAQRLGLDTSDNWLLTMPLYHLGGLSIVFRSVLYGTTITLIQRFDESAILEAIEKHEVSQISLVPTMFQRLIITDDNLLLKTLRVILLGGAACPNVLLRNANELDLPVALTYGMTETCSQFATAPPGYQNIKLGSVGKPLLFNNFRIINSEGKILGPDQTGMLVIKSPTLMNGYLYAGSDQEYYNSDGYFITGDIAYTDADGDLFILQRRSDLIISGGENIYPREIENIILDFQEINDCVVLALDDDKWGQVPVAILQLNSTISSREIRLRVAEVLASYKIPKKFFILDDFPRTGSGKIIRQVIKSLLDRNELRELN